MYKQFDKVIKYFEGLKIVVLLAINTPNTGQGSLSKVNGRHGFWCIPKTINMNSYM